MGSRNGWAAELAKRCEDVGWEVTWGPGGHRRIKTHKGKVFSLASSTSDVHGQKNAERACVRHGLEQLEQKIALLKAKERLERIEEDRKNGVDWEAEDKKREEEMAISKIDGDLGYVDGIAIAEIAPAMYATKRPGEERRMVPHMQELLLTDGTIRLRCDMDGDTGPCHRTANSVQGISIHQARTHTGAYKLKTSDAPTSKEKVVTVDKRGTIVKVEDVKPEGFKLEPTGVKITATLIEADENEAPEIIQKQPGIIARLVYLADEFDELVDEASELAESVRVKRTELRKLLAELPSHILTDEVKEKLETYEQLKSMLK